MKSKNIVRAILALMWSILGMAHLLGMKFLPSRILALTIATACFVLVAKNLYRITMGS